jgi:hypothetical protein
MPISLPQEASSPRTGSHQRMILACTRTILVGHAVELATAQPPPTTTARSKPTPRPAQHHLRQLRAPGSDAGRPRAGHGRSRRPRRPRPSQPYGCLPHRRAPGPHCGRTQRTRKRTNTRRPHRTADTWTLRRPHRTPDTGPVDRQAWTLVARTGHRTPDTRTLAEDVDRLTRRGRHPDLLGHHAERPRAGTPNRVLVDGACDARQPMQLGGEAAFQREIASRRQLLGRSAGVQRRLGALLS